MLGGPVFHFLVGKHQKTMTVHMIPIAEQSAALASLVSGSMKEARIGTVTWEHVDEETFARWAQFLYTGDYSPASCVIAADPATCFEETSSSPEPQADALPDLSLDQWSFQELSKAKQPAWKGGESSERCRFHDLANPIPSVSKISNKSKIRPNGSSIEDYSPVFLGHARLYVFAEKWGIESLQTLALHKLHATLCKYKPYQERYGDVTELIKYTYQNTPTRESIDGLRALVTKYVAQEQRQIAKSEPCLSLVEDEGSFARDLLSMVLELGS